MLGSFISGKMCCVNICRRESIQFLGLIFWIILPQVFSENTGQSVCETRALRIKQGSAMFHDFYPGYLAGESNLFVKSRRSRRTVSLPPGDFRIAPRNDTGLPY